VPRSVPSSATQRKRPALAAAASGRWPRQVRTAIPLIDVLEGQAASTLVGTVVAEKTHFGVLAIVGKDKYTGYGTLQLTSLLNALENETQSSLTAQAFSSSELSNLLNYPNPVPAGTNTTFGFSSDTNTDITIKVYTIRGQLLRTLTSTKTPVSNYIKVSYDLTDERGQRLPMDVYLYTVEATDTVGTIARGKGKLVVVN
jgi:hypothetical protein